MDLRFESSDGQHWIELRDTRPTDESVFRARLRFPFANEVLSHHFWFDRDDLNAFVREAKWLERSTGGHASFGPIARSDSITLVRDRHGWTIAAEAFDLRDPDGRARVSFPMDSLAARDLIRRFETLVEMSAPVS